MPNFDSLKGLFDSGLDMIIGDGPKAVPSPSLSSSNLNQSPFFQVQKEKEKEQAFESQKTFANPFQAAKQLNPQQQQQSSSYPTNPASFGYGAPGYQQSGQSQYNSEVSQNQLSRNGSDAQYANDYQRHPYELSPPKQQNSTASSQMTEDDDDLGFGNSSLSKNKKPKGKTTTITKHTRKKKKKK